MNSETPNSTPGAAEPGAPVASGGRSVRLLSALVLVAVFVSGVLVGAGAMRWALPGPLGAPPGAMPRGFRELDLSAEQRRRANEVMERHKPELDAILQETFPKVRAVNEQIRADLGELLTPQQSARLEELERRPPPGRPPAGPLPPPRVPDGPPPFGGHRPGPPPSFDPVDGPPPPDAPPPPAAEGWAPPAPP